MQYDLWRVTFAGLNGYSLGAVQEETPWGQAVRLSILRDVAGDPYGDPLAEVDLLVTDLAKLVTQATDMVELDDDD